MSRFELSRRKAAALLFMGPAFTAAPALAAAPPGRKAAPKKRAAVAQRAAFSAEEQQLAEVPGFAGVRFFGDADRPFVAATQEARGPWLALSSGGEDGAYGAGLLAGMSAAGTRPAFALVTGVSTGALMAPFVFLGPRYDAALRRSYTNIHAGDVFELAATPESLFDTWPLKKTIEKNVSAELLAEIAAEHAKGRRLMVATTNLDAARPVVWDMGAIAARGGEQALRLFRDVLLASSSIPGFFPPVHIEVEANGRRFSEMHADGAVRAPFYVAPEGVLAGAAPLAASEIYVLVNNKLATDFQVTERSMPAVLARSISVALKLGLRAEIVRIAAAAQRRNLPLRLSLVPANFSITARGAFDPDYMQALYELGSRQAQRGAAFRQDVYAALNDGAAGG